MNVLCPKNLVYGNMWTKDFRNTYFGGEMRGCNSRKIENYQKQMMYEGTGIKLEDSNHRINILKNEFVEKTNPMVLDDGYDYTENFDVLQRFGNKRVFINLKNVVGRGGSQTRTLRDECYAFVKAQINLVNENKVSDTYFINVFDGDESHRNMKKFEYILKTQGNEMSSKYIYVGNLKDYFDTMIFLTKL